MIVRDMLGVVSGGPADAVNHSEKCELISPQKDVLEMVFCVAAYLPG